jgi:hypothetical protein
MNRKSLTSVVHSSIIRFNSFVVFVSSVRQRHLFFELCLINSIRNAFESLDCHSRDLFVPRLLVQLFTCYKEIQSYLRAIVFMNWV